MSLHKEEFYEQQVWPGWISGVLASPHRAIFLHGIMGSELYDDVHHCTRWVDMNIWHEVDELAFETLSPDGAIDVEGQLVYARSTVSLPMLGQFYAPYLGAIGSGRFNFDWRDAIGIESQRLGRFLELLLERDPKLELRLVTHSMGGCVLLRLLATTSAFDSRIRSVVFVAPPFWGALRPLRVIEDGNGTPVDIMISNAVLEQSAASMPGLFNLLVAPPDVWPLDPGLGIPKLAYPIRGGDLYVRCDWTNRARWDLRQPLLDSTRNYYLAQSAGAAQVVRRLGDRISVIVGVNGNTEYCAQLTPEWDWVVHSAPPPGGDALSNGDGSVLVQSSVLPNLDPKRYWAYVPGARSSSHASLPNLPEVQAAMRALLQGEEPVAGGALQPLPAIVPRIDWSSELQGAAAPEPFDHLDYVERARLRSLTPVSERDRRLDPDGADERLFHHTRTAAFKVLSGASDVEREASRIGKPPAFLRNHVQALVAPLLFG